MSDADKIVPVGVLININGDYYIVPFTGGCEPLTAPTGAGFSMQMQDMEISPWLGPTTPGILPITELRHLDNPLRPTPPAPPQFDNPDDAAKWLEEHPYAVLDRAVGGE